MQNLISRSLHTALLTSAILFSLELATITVLPLPLSLITKVDIRSWLTSPSTAATLIYNPTDTLYLLALTFISILLVAVNVLRPILNKRILITSLALILVVSALSSWQLQQTVPLLGFLKDVAELAKSFRDFRRESEDHHNDFLERMVRVETKVDSLERDHRE